MTVAELQNRLDEADAKLRARRDLLPPEVDARVTELTLLAAANDVAAKEEIAKIAVEFLSRYRDLVYCETCSPPQVSKPAQKLRPKRNRKRSAREWARAPRPFRKITPQRQSRPLRRRAAWGGQ